MSRPLPVLTAVTGPGEAALVAGLADPSSGVEVVRRCADLGELVSAAAAGLARAAVVSGDLPRLDRDVVIRLARSGVAVVGLAPAGAGPCAKDDGAASSRLTGLGVHRVLPADAPAGAIADAVTAAVAAMAEAGGATVLDLRPGPGGLLAADPGPGPADPGSALPAGPRLPAGQAPAPDPGQPPAVGRVIAVWGPVGAPGRTTVAVSLAAEVASRGRDCLLVDADTYGASVAQTLGLLDESAGLVAAARAANQGQLRARRLAEIAPLVTGRLRVLTGLPQPHRWTELRPSALEVVWDQARRIAACTIIDVGFGLDADEELMFDTAAPRRHGAALSALAAADLVLAVGSADPIGLQRLLSGLPQLRAVTGAAAPIQVVITKVRDEAIGGTAGSRVRAALRRYADVTDPVLVPDDRSALDAAMLAGRTLTEAAPSSPARLAIGALADQLLAPGEVLDDGRAPVAGRSRRRGPRAPWRRLAPLRR